MIESKWEISSDGYYPYCVNCHTEPPGRVLSPYCPNCGAKMKNERYAIKETIYTNCKDSHKEMIDYIEPEHCGSYEHRHTRNSRIY